MRWHLDNPNADARRTSLEEKGWRIPEHLYPPDIWPGAESWFEVFFELGTDRQIGMGLGPIPAASIDRHVARWPDADAQTFRQAIRAMDAVYLKHHAKEPDVPETDNAARDAFRAAMR